VLSLKSMVFKSFNADNSVGTDPIKLLFSVVKKMQD